MAKTHRLAMISIQYEHGTSITLEQFSCFRHNLRHQAFQVALLFKYASRQCQKDLIPLVLKNRGLEELGVLDPNAAEREVATEYFHITG
jgi:hypothetical protein